jgi:YidC/Oxa1 family membrane protein insertase
MPIMIALFYAIRQPLSLMMGVAREFWEEGSEIYNKLVELGSPPDLEGFYAEVYIAQNISHYWDIFKEMGVEGLKYISFNLGFVNLAEQPDWQFLWSTDWTKSAIWLPGLVLFFLPFISGGAQFASASIMRKMSPTGSPEAAGGTAGTILKFMPLMSVWFGFILPAALSFYWTIGTVLQIGQDIWLTKKYTKILDEEDAERDKVRKEKEAELEAKREETERKRAEGLVERNRNTAKRKKLKSDKQEQLGKAAEWEKKNTPDNEKEVKYEPGRVGNRRFARGRAYDPDRYGTAVDEGITSEEKDDIEGHETDVDPDSGIRSPEDGFSDESDVGAEQNGDFESEDDYVGDEDEDDYDEDDEDYGEDEDYDENEDSSEEAPPTTRFETTRFDSNDK